MLDPYGLHLDWRVIAQAGSMRTLDVFLNFPVLDMNRKVLWHDPTNVDPEDIRRMTKFWGDESWRNVAYQPVAQRSMFGEDPLEKVQTEAIAAAFRKRLEEVARFKYVPEPIPMRNQTNSIVYYLFFASANKTAELSIRRYRPDDHLLAFSKASDTKEQQKI